MNNKSIRLFTYSDFRNATHIKKCKLIKGDYPATSNQFFILNALDTGKILSIRCVKPKK